MANKTKKDAELWEEGFIDLTTDEIRSSSAVKPIEIEDITDDIKPTEPEAPYIKRGKKKYYKTTTKYVYKVDDRQYVYRLFLKNEGRNIDRYYDCHPETKKPLRTEEDAEKALTIHKHIISGDATFINEKVTFGQVWEHFLNSEHDRAKETIRRYTSIYEIHVKHIFANKPIQDIKPVEYSEFLKKIYKHGTARKENKEEKITANERRRKKVTNGYSLAYVESMLKFFYLVMHYAAQLDIISYEKYNKFRDNCKPPKAQKKKDKQKIRVLTRQQIADIKELLKDTDFYLPFLVALLCGTRPAETFALRFSDFDFKNNILSINKQIVDEEGALVIKNPKTEDSTRDILVSDYLLSEVKKRMEYLEKQRQLNPKAFATNKGRVIDGREFEEPTMDMPDDMMCRDSKGRYVTAHSFSYYTKLIKKDIAPNNDEYEDFSFYTFRKTHLSNMAANNCPIGELMKRAGHSKVERLYENYYQTSETATEKLKQALTQFETTI